MVDLLPAFPHCCPIVCVFSSAPRRQVRHMTCPKLTHCRLPEEGGSAACMLMGGARMQQRRRTHKAACISGLEVPIVTLPNQEA